MIKILKSQYLKRIGSKHYEKILNFFLREKNFQNNFQTNPSGKKFRRIQQLIHRLLVLAA